MTTVNVAIIGNVTFAVLNVSRNTENAPIQIAIRWVIFRRDRMSDTIKIKATWYCGERCLICPVCGEDSNSEDANFCWRCGQFLKAWEVEDEDG